MIITAHLTREQMERESLREAALHPAWAWALEDKTSSGFRISIESIADVAAVIADKGLIATIRPLEEGDWCLKWPNEQWTYEERKAREGKLPMLDTKSESK